MRVIVRKSDGYIDKLDLGQECPDTHARREVEDAVMYQDGAKYRSVDGSVRVEAPTASPSTLHEIIEKLTARVAALESKVR